MKTRLAKIMLVGLVGLLAIATFPTPESFAKKPVTLRWASVHAPPGLSPTGDIGKAFQEEVTRRTKGLITFESFWGSSMGAPAAHIDMVRDGLVNIIQTHQWFTPARMPFGDFEFVFPFGPTDFVLVATAMRQIRAEFPQFRIELEKNNAILLADPLQGSYNFLSRYPIRTLDDFKGRRVGLIGRYFGRWLPPGAAPVVRPAAERYDLLRTGVTQLDLNPFDNQIAFKLHEVTGYFIENLVLTTCAPMPILMNLDTFNRLSPEFQTILLEVGRDIEMLAAKEIFPRWWNQALRDWKAAGVKFVRFNDGEQEKWAATLDDIPAEWAADMEKIGLPGFKLVHRWQEITSDLGFKWPRKWGIKK